MARNRTMVPSTKPCQIHNRFKTNHHRSEEIVICASKHSLLKQPIQLTNLDSVRRNSTPPPNQALRCMPQRQHQRQRQRQQSQTVKHRGE